MSRTANLFVGFILIILVPFWIYIISPEILKLPANISINAEMIHTENNRFEINSPWAGKSIAIGSSSIKTFLTSGNKSTLQTLFRVESLTGETLFELNQTFVVDRLTYHDLPGGNDSGGKSSILFSPNLAKDSIAYWPVEMGSQTPVKYIGTKTIQGIKTYHFSTPDFIVYDTLGYEFLPLVPETYKVLSRVMVDVYVDPLTGIIIDRQDSGTSYYAENDNTRVWDIAQWSNKYNDNTIARRVSEAGSLGVKYFTISRTIPFVSAVLGIILTVAGLKNKNTKNSRKKR